MSVLRVIPMSPDMVRAVTAHLPLPTVPTMLCSPPPVREFVRVIGKPQVTLPETESAPSVNPVLDGIPQQTSPETVSMAILLGIFVKVNATSPEVE